ncbi:MAG: tRNA (adenosine(37)-N6)-threonylcarbamoyltransferase complex dimerization subunit type 1 TsaB [Rhodospirillales bacterium]|nr:tRNA (adenosine(37)-N6)-threonylcarbamoyltransferase complex dimerization subunit type 1 TsaB [Rhodospirillales bacterium]
MKILALDTATTACSVAACRDGKTLASAHELMVRGQSEALIPMVLAVLAQARMEVRDFDLIAVTRGPGAFTGLRIGLAAARGLALASGVPCCGISTTQAIAEAARRVESDRQPIIVALDSKRSDIYIQAFDPHGIAVCEPQAIAVTDLRQRIDGLALTGAAGPVAVVGDAATRALALLPDGYYRSSAPDVPDARDVASVAAQLHATGQQLPAPIPLYLRPADAALPKNGGRLRP